MNTFENNTTFDTQKIENKLQALDAAIAVRDDENALEYEVKENSSILNQTLLEADIPEGVLIVMIKRNNEIVIPNGSTVIMLGDILVLSGIDTDEFNL